MPETPSNTNQSDLPLLMGVRFSTPPESASASPRALTRRLQYPEFTRHLESLPCRPKPEIQNFPFLNNLAGQLLVAGLPQLNREVFMHLSRRSYVLIGSALLVTVALGLAGATYAVRSDRVTLPAATPIHVTLDQALASNQSRSGDHFEATVSEPVIVEGKTVGVARLHLELVSVEVSGENYPLRTTSAFRRGGDHKKRNIALIGGGAGAGTVVGAIAAGGKGALIGGPVGAGAGTAVAFLTGKKDIRLPPETSLTFKLAEPVTIRPKG